MFHKTSTSSFQSRFVWQNQSQPKQKPTIVDTVRSGGFLYNYVVTWHFKWIILKYLKNISEFKIEVEGNNKLKGKMPSYLFHFSYKLYSPKEK